MLENKRKLDSILVGNLVKDTISNSLIILNLNISKAFVGSDEK